MPVEYEPFEERWRRDPYPIYRALRENDPVHWAPEAGVYCVSRYDDVLEVLRDPERFSSRAMLTMMMKTELDGPIWSRYLPVVEFLLRTRINPFALARTETLIVADPPRHDALRAVVNRGFTPRRVQAWRDRAREVAAACAAKLGRGEAFDVVRDLAVPLPVTIIAELLGVEPERERDFKHWSDAIVSSSTGSARTGGMNRALMRPMADLYQYLSGVLDARRQDPGDDLISVIIAAQDGALTLGDIDVFQFVLLLLVAGNETTTNLIGNAVQALLDHPDQLEMVIESPNLIPQLVEETLRYDAPIQLLFRTVTRDTEIGGVPIPAGAVVAPLLASANRDELRFPSGDCFDIMRDTQGHLGFGHGVHFCLGASLARLEAVAALEVLVPELPRLARSDAPAPRVDSFLVRGVTRLELIPKKAEAA